MYHGIDPKRHAIILDYLRPFKVKLLQRATKQEWYELQQPQMAFAPAYDGPKILFPDIAKEPRFAFDDEGHYFGNTAYMLQSDDLYLLGVLNSSTIWQWVQANFQCLGDPRHGGRFRFFTQSVEILPIPDAPSGDRAGIAGLVEGCLDDGGRGPRVLELEREIDERVAFLYGLPTSDSAPQAVRAESR